ncbi:MAG: ABC transporter permease subunit [Myxococcota bacterium]
MLHRIATVAFNAYREAVRARVLLGLAGVAFAVAFYSLVVGSFTLRDAPRVVADLGAATISVFSIAVAILIGATSLYRELEMKTILPLLARPIRRAEYLVGKFVGTMTVVLVFAMAETGLVLMMSAVLGGRSVAVVVGVAAALLIALAGASVGSQTRRTFAPIPWAMAMLGAGLWLSAVAPLERSLVMSSATLTVLEVMIVASLATLFSSFSTPFVSSLLTVGTIVVGRNADSLTQLPPRVFGPAISTAGEYVGALWPNLQVYVPARPLLTGEALEANLPRYLGQAGLQSLGWTVALLTVAAVVFQRRDFV